MIKCSCGMVSCEMQASLDEGTGCLTVERFSTINEPVVASMYLDANGAVELIKALKRFLLAQADKP